MSLRDAADPPTDAAFAERVQADLVRGQYHLTTPVEFAGAGYSLVLGWALWNHVPHAALGGWVLLRLLVTAIRIGHGLSFVRDPRSAERTRLWQRRFLLMAITEGLSWGLLPVLALPTGDSALDGVVLASLVGVASIGLFVTQGIASTGIAFSLCALLPQLAVHLQMGTRSGWAAVGGLVVLIGVLVYEAWRGERNLVELVRLRHHEQWMATRYRESMLLAEQSSAAKSRFLANVSHEVRTPLNGILGMTQLLHDDADDAAQRARLEVVAQSARHLRTVIDDILDMSSIESGRLRIELQPFDLRAALHDVCLLLEPLARQRGLGFELRIDAALPASWLGDAARVRQVLHNLLGNAIKFTDHGSVLLTVGAGAGRLHFDVADSGRGIDAAALERIFEPFEQADGGADRSVGGTGLGLPISRQIARAMGGEVRCLHSSAQGSSFRFEFPSRPLQPHAQPGAVPPADAIAKPPAAAGAEGGARVLVVEDNMVNAMVARAMLGQFGMASLHADGGQAALELLQRQPFDIVMMDCQMPGLDGFETTRRWRAIEAARQPAGRLPIIAVTASAGATNREQCLAAGMDGFIAKPFEMEELRALLERHLAAPAQRLAQAHAPGSR